MWKNKKCSKPPISCSTASEICRNIMTKYIRICLPNSDPGLDFGWLYAHRPQAKNETSSQLHLSLEKCKCFLKPGNGHCTCLMNLMMPSSEHSTFYLRNVNFLVQTQKFHGFQPPFFQQNMAPLEKWICFQAPPASRVRPPPHPRGFADETNSMM